MKGTRINRQIEQLFLQVLDKTEYEGQLHTFGEFSFLFNRVNNLDVKFDPDWPNDNEVPPSILYIEQGYHFSIYQVRNGKNKWHASFFNNYAKSIQEVIEDRGASSQDSIKLFKKEFMEYLDFVRARDLANKLQNTIGEKKTKTTINKI